MSKKYYLLSDNIVEKHSLDLILDNRPVLGRKYELTFS